MKTNNIKILLGAICVSFGIAAALTSCTDLDSDKYFEDRKTLESVFTDRIQCDQWLAHAYSFLNGCNIEVGSKGATGADGGAWNPFNFDDDMYYGDRDNSFGDSKDADYASYNSFHEGNYDESEGQNAWVRCYQGIYQASIFIHHIGLNKAMSTDEVEDYRGQARFVRAYYYWLLLRKFGPVPIMPDEGADYTLAYDELATPRSTYEECATYIADQMLQAARELKSYKRDENNVMRPTIGAALATRAIVLTYAASPLANGQLQNGHHPANVTDDVAKQLKNFDGTPLLSLTYDETKWARAAAACKDVIDLNVYQLYTESFNDVATDDRPITVVPPYDAEFSDKNWPDGWKNIDPYLSYRNLFNGVASAAANSELIFTRNIDLADHDNGLASLVGHSMPTSLNGWNTHGLTQKMVDTYYMKDGTDVDGMYREWRTPGATTVDNPGNDRDRATGFITRSEAQNDTYPEVLVNPTNRSLGNQQRMNVSHQYCSREPRFYASVAYNGTIWEQLGKSSTTDHNRQVTYYRSGPDGYRNSFAYLRTGIGVKKYYHPQDYFDQQPNGEAQRYSHINQKFEPAIRYADILLMYAECLNELTEGGSYQQTDWKGNDVTIKGRDLAEMKRGIRPVRIRAGLPDYSLGEYANKDDLRAKIKRERMIEFMGEGKRYFDLRRWMDAPVEENKRVYGLNVFQTMQNKDEFMQVIPVYNLSATFTDKMYFWPISFTDLKRNKNLVQNPGWKYND